ncbi:hypothetical protein DID80_05310 [Candidatus Marinamargulisbacteria bacterium SCGC AAA071-K20]|nr:hypothetical protein DID80_05310 [Candidatus Marinamargulisbacteria bacterium SCGC AAA071-K20]
MTLNCKIIFLGILLFFTGLNASTFRISVAPNPVQVGDKLRITLFSEGGMEEPTLKIFDKTMLFSRVGEDVFMSSVSVPETALEGEYTFFVTIQLNNQTHKLPYTVQVMTPLKVEASGNYDGAVNIIEQSKINFLNMKIDELAVQNALNEKDRKSLEIEIERLKKEMTQLSNKANEKNKLAEQSKKLLALENKLASNLEKFEIDQKQLQIKLRELTVNQEAYDELKKILDAQKKEQSKLSMKLSVKESTLRNKEEAVFQKGEKNRIEKELLHARKVITSGRERDIKDKENELINLKKAMIDQQVQVDRKGRVLIEKEQLLNDEFVYIQNEKAQVTTEKEKLQDQILDIYDKKVILDKDKLSLQKELKRFKKKQKKQTKRESKITEYETRIQDKLNVVSKQEQLLSSTEKKYRKKEEKMLIMETTLSKKVKRLTKREDKLKDSKKLIESQKKQLHFQINRLQQLEEQLKVQAKKQDKKFKNAQAGYDKSKSELDSKMLEFQEMKDSFSDITKQLQTQGKLQKIQQLNDSIMQQDMLVSSTKLTIHRNRLMKQLEFIKFKSSLEEKSNDSLTTQKEELIHLMQDISLEIKKKI